MDRPWTHKESLFLAQAAERCGLPWCASELRRTVEDCALQLKALKTGAEDAEWMTPGDAGALASCSAATIRTLVGAGQIEGRKDSRGRWLVKRSSVAAYAGRHQRNVAAGISDRPKKTAPERRDSILDHIEMSPESETPEETPERPKIAEEAPVVEKELERAKKQEKGRPRPRRGAPAGWVTMEAYAEAAGLAVKQVQWLCWKRRLSCIKWCNKLYVAEDEIVALKHAEPEPETCISEPMLESMSKLDILKALASGRVVGGCRVV